MKFTLINKRKILVILYKSREQISHFEDIKLIPILR